VPGLVSHVGAEVPADNAVPGGVVLLVELLLDVGRDVLLNVVLLQSLSCAVNSVLKVLNNIIFIRASFKIICHFHPVEFDI